MRKQDLQRLYALPVQVAGKAHAYSEERVLRFASEVRAATAEQLAHAAASTPGLGDPAGPAHVGEGATAPEELQPCVYFLPGAHLRACWRCRLCSAPRSLDPVRSSCAHAHKVLPACAGWRDCQYQAS